MLTDEVVEADSDDGYLVPVSEVPPLIWDGCSYQLYGLRCPNCGGWHYRVARTAGAFYSLYIPPDDFAPAQFEEYCRQLHENLQIDRRAVIGYAKGLISEHNSPGGIDCNSYYTDALMDFVRVRLKSLTATGHLRAIEEGRARTPAQERLLMAFDLGYAISELRLKDDYEDEIMAAARLHEGREAGREAAALAKRRTTRQTREAILKAARELHANNPALVRNDAATSRAIEAMHLPALCRHGQTSIGHDAIAKHLRALHKENAL